MMMKSDVIDLTVQKLHETEKAVLVTDSIPEKGVWLARSQIEIEPCETGGLYTVTLPEWLALEKGLI
jgi:hypothetical protein